MAIHCNLEVQRETDAFLRKIKREKIREPGPDQYVDQCHYSKTGWAIWDKGGACTCKPAKRPRLTRT
jgi:hypothetical protein